MWIEFGQMYRRFGSDITVLEHGDRFLSRKMKTWQQQLNSFKGGSNNHLYNAELVRVQGKAPNIIATVKIKNEEKTIACSHILFLQTNAKYRGAKLAAAGIAVDKRGFIVADEKLQTSVQAFML
jgi:pyruvate/2-oxoglutarate dehydrogenase complex dihydrolipoamide dehydrogenase (E3) component